MSAPGHGSERPQQVVVVGPDGQPVGALALPQGADGDQPESIGDMVEQPAKVMRIGTMIKQLLEEGLSPELREELERITLPFTEGETPSDAELRIAQAQLVGWLEGVFHGIQTALFAQQMAARAQLEDVRRKALPGGQSAPQAEQRPGGGQYL